MENFNCSYEALRAIKESAEHTLAMAVRNPIQYRGAVAGVLLDQCENVIEAWALRDEAMKRLVETLKWDDARLQSSLPGTLAMGSWWIAHDVLVSAAVAHQTALEAL